MITYFILISLWILIGLIGMLYACKFNWNNIKTHKKYFLIGSLFGLFVIILIFIEYLFDNY